MVCLDAWVVDLWSVA